MLVRILSKNDLDHVYSCLVEHDTCYGVKIDHEVLLERNRELIDTGNVLGAFVGGYCLGVCSQKFWKLLPAWVLSNLYLKKNSQGLYMGKKEFNVVGALMEFGIKNAESKNYFEFYYVVRDGVKPSRKLQGLNYFLETNPDIPNRYNFDNIHILQSREDVNWAYLDNIVGIVGKTALDNKKTLVVRRATIKQEYRFK